MIYNVTNLINKTALQNCALTFEIQLFFRFIPHGHFQKALIVKI